MSTSLGPSLNSPLTGIVSSLLGRFMGSILNRVITSRLRNVEEMSCPRTGATHSQAQLIIPDIGLVIK